MLAPSWAAANALAASAPWEYPTATLTPRSASRVLIASPIPRAPPVTSATCPTIPAIVASSLLGVRLPAGPWVLSFDGGAGAPALVEHRLMPRVHPRPMVPFLAGRAARWPRYRRRAASGSGGVAA